MISVCRNVSQRDLRRERRAYACIVVCVLFLAVEAGTHPLSPVNAEMLRGIGCDVAKVARVQRLLESRHAKRFLEKAFVSQEVIDCTTAQGDTLVFEKLASRWAAKEAAYKALRLETFSPRFYEMWVCKDKRVPQLVLLGETKLAAERENVGAIHLSMSHDSEYCFATVICEHRAK